MRSPHGTRRMASMLLLLSAAPAFGQGEILPNQGSAGLAIVTDRQPRQTAPAATVSLAFFDLGRFGLISEYEFGSASDSEPCQARGVRPANAPHCHDAAALFGAEFYFHRRPARTVLPFVNLQVGSYWKGSGVEDSRFVSEHFALQPAGGVELRRADADHGVRLSLAYRRVFATGAPRNQLRFAVAYVLGCPCREQ